MQHGDFSVLLTAPSPIQLYDPLNTVTPFPEYVGNVGVPIINPVAKFLFANPQLYPDCGGDNPVTPSNGMCVPPNDGIAGSNYEAVSTSYKGNNQGDVKIEYDPRAADKFTGFYSISHAYDGSIPVLAITFPGVNLYPTWITGANWVHTFSPSLVNSARIGFTRTDWNQGFPVDTTGQFGTSGNAKVGISFPNQRFNGFTNQGFNANISDVGTTAYNGGVIDNTYSYVDNLTWQRGRHFISAGMDARRYQNNYPTGNNDGYLGSLNYSGVFTSNGNGSGGYGPADFVLDRVQSGGVTLSSVNVGQRQWRVAGFAAGQLQNPRQPHVDLRHPLRIRRTLGRRAGQDRKHQSDHRADSVCRSHSRGRSASNSGLQGSGTVPHRPATSRTTGSGCRTSDLRIN